MELGQLITTGKQREIQDIILKLCNCTEKVIF